MLQLTQAGAVFQGTAADVCAMQRTFACHHVLVLRQFLPDSLLHFLQRRLVQAAFVSAGRAGFFAEHRLQEDEPVLAHLRFLTNDPALFRWIEVITGCEPIGCYSGRVYRRLPGAEHYDDWHEDVGQSRMVGLSINLSAEVFAGGALRLRDTVSRRLLCEYANTGFGDAVLFRISPALQHIVMPVEGTVARTAFAGWFRQEDDYTPSLVTSPHQEVMRHGHRLTLTQRVHVVNDVAYHAVDDTLLLHHSATARICQLNSTGRQIFEQLLATGCPMTAISALQAEYDVAPAEAAAACQYILDELTAQGMVVAG
jgi:hypothetical protein